MDRVQPLLPTALAVLFLLAGCTSQQGRVTTPPISGTPAPTAPAAKEPIGGPAQPSNTPASPTPKAPEAQAVSGTIKLDAAEAVPVWKASDPSALPYEALWVDGIAYVITKPGTKETVYAVDREGRERFRWAGPLYPQVAQSAISTGALAPNGMVALHNQKDKVIEVLDAQGKVVASPAVKGRVIIEWINGGRHFLVTDFTSGALPQLYTANGQFVGDLTPAGVQPIDVRTAADPLQPWIALSAGARVWVLNEGKPFWQGQFPEAPSAVATTDGGQLWAQLDNQVLMLDQGKQVWAYPLDKQKRARALLAPESGRTWLLASEGNNRYVLQLLGPDGQLQGNWNLQSAQSIGLAGVNRTGDLVFLNVSDPWEGHLYAVDETGKTVWHSRGRIAGMSADGRRVYVAKRDSGGLMAFDLPKSR